MYFIHGATVVLKKQKQKTPSEAKSFLRSSINKTLIAIDGKGALKQNLLFPSDFHSFAFHTDMHLATLLKINCLCVLVSGPGTEVGSGWGSSFLWG